MYTLNLVTTQSLYSPKVVCIAFLFLMQQVTSYLLRYLSPSEAETGLPVVLDLQRDSHTKLNKGSPSKVNLAHLIQK